MAGWFGTKPPRRKPATCSTRLAVTSRCAEGHLGWMAVRQRISQAWTCIIASFRALLGARRASAVTLGPPWSIPGRRALGCRSGVMRVTLTATVALERSPSLGEWREFHNALATRMATLA